MADFIVKILLILILMPNRMDAPPIRRRKVTSCQFNMKNKPCILENARTQWVNEGDNASVTWVLALPEEMAVKLYGDLKNISLKNLDLPIITGRNVSSKYGDWEGWYPEYHFSPQDGHHLLNITISLVKAKLEDASRFHLEFHAGDVTYKTGHVLLFNVKSKEASSAWIPDNQRPSTTTLPNKSVSKPTISPATVSSGTSHSSSDYSKILARLDEHDSILHSIKWMVLSIIIGLVIPVIACTVEKWATMKRILLRIYSLLVNRILTPMQQCFGRLRQFWSSTSSSQSLPPSQLSSPSPRPPPNLPTSQPHPPRDNNGAEQEHKASTTNPNSTSVLSDTKSTSKEAGNEETQGMTVPNGDGPFSSNSPTVSEEGHENQTQAEIHHPQNMEQMEKEQVVTTTKDSKSTTVDLQETSHGTKCQAELNLYNNMLRSSTDRDTSEEEKGCQELELQPYQCSNKDACEEMTSNHNEMVPPEHLDDQEEVHLDQIAERTAQIQNETSPLMGSGKWKTE